MIHGNTRRRLGLYTIAALVIFAISMATTVFLLGQLQPAKTAGEAPTTAQPVTSKPSKSEGLTYSIPTKLIIPKIAVDADILPMGLTPGGDMESPLTNEDTGWYKYGTRPGNEGSAVIDGHLGLSGEAVFGKLHQLAVGDVISVVDDHGATVSFAVREIKAYDKDSNATDVFDKQTGAHLNLITCDGDWEAQQATYSERLVIFSDRVGGKA